MHRLLTVADEAFLREVARVLREARRDNRWGRGFRAIPEEIAAEWERRFEEIAGVKA